MKKVILIGLLVVMSFSIVGCVSSKTCEKIRNEGYDWMDRFVKYNPSIKYSQNPGPTLQYMINKYGSYKIHCCLQKTEHGAFRPWQVDTIKKERYWEQDRIRYDKTLKNSISLSFSIIKNTIGTSPSWMYSSVFIMGKDIWRIDYSMGHTYTTSSHTYVDRWYKDAYDRYMVFHYIDGKLNSYSKH